MESPRAAAQLFYQFDDLFHDNAIFSPHPTIALQLVVQKNLIWWTQPEVNPDISYDIVQGDLNTLRSTGGDFFLATTACLADNRSTNSLDTPDSPAPGDGFWFLVRMVDEDAGVGSYDEPSGSQIGSRDPGIDDSPAGCP